MTVIHSIRQFRLASVLLGSLLVSNMASANVISVDNAAVSSRSMLASEAGVSVMKRGGNAVDAAVATAFALAVTYPSAGNLGGGGFAVIRTPLGEVYTNDHREKAPLAAHRDMFLDENGDYDPRLSRQSHLASGVPGSVRGLLDIHERFGLLDRETVIQPALELARDGFELPSDLARHFERRYERFSAIPSTTKVFYKPDGSFYETGDVFRQPDLYETLKRISDHGAEGFYTGDTADLIVAEMQRGGGLISHEDLQSYESVWREPVRGTYRGYTIHSMPPPSSGGILLVQMLNMLEHFDIDGMGFQSASTVHTMIEVERRAYADRAIHLGDTDFYDVPLTQLGDKGYAAHRVASISSSTATDSDDISEGSVPYESPETTHFSVIDSDGMAVAFTTTINAGYGSGIVVEGAGFLLNNEMDDFSAKPGTPNMFGLVGAEANAIEPSKRMLSSMTPTIVEKDNDFLLITGSPGGSTIITTVLQVVVNVADHGLSVEEAVNQPRFHHQWQPNRVQMESGLPDQLIQELESMGHVNVEKMSEGARIGDANSILLREGVIRAVSDGRNLGGAAGF